jgi:hypothetical protein
MLNWIWRKRFGGRINRMRPLKRVKEIIDQLTAKRDPTDLKTLDARLQYANALKADDRLDEAAKAYDALIMDRTGCQVRATRTQSSRKNRILVDILRGKAAATNGDRQCDEMVGAITCRDEVVA